MTDTAVISERGVADRGENVMPMAGSSAPASSVTSAVSSTAIPAPPTGAAQAQSAAQQIAASLTPLPDGVLEITLQPEELGRLRLSLSGGDAGHSLVVSADRDETLALLKRHEAMLAREFAALGFGGLSLSFEHAGDGQDDQTAPEHEHDPPPHVAAAAVSDPAAGLIATARLDLRL